MFPLCAQRQSRCVALPAGATLLNLNIDNDSYTYRRFTRACIPQRTL